MVGSTCAVNRATPARCAAAASTRASAARGLPSFTPRARAAAKPEAVSLGKALRRCALGFDAMPRLALLPGAYANVGDELGHDALTDSAGWSRSQRGRRGAG